MLETLLLFDPGLLLSFVAAGLLLNITPGVDFLLIATSAINGGAGSARAVAVGINLGVLIHIIMAAAGFTALLLAYPVAYTALLAAGALYLLFMAYQLWFSGSVDNSASNDISVADSFSRSEAIKRGFITNALNPKTALFIFAFIPQFTSPAYGPVWQQILILGFIFLINGLLFSFLLASTAGFLSPVLKKHIRSLNKVTSILFCLLALRLLFI